jgi:ubiquinone/menaquinone biosynthesis C-methylase UbiE
MDHAEMVALIRRGVPGTGGVWADLGAGTGNFTLALAELLGAAGVIYAVDRDARALATLRNRLAHSPPAAAVHPVQADVTRLPALPRLDGVLMANLLHFLADPVELLRRLRAGLQPGGRIVIVEYAQTTPLPWVPYPVPWARLAALADEAGFAPARQVGSRRSARGGREMYAAVAQLDRQHAAGPALDT